MLTQPNTWTWNGSNWTQITPATVPGGRVRPSLAWDPASSQLILFGGSNGGVVYFNDTWLWNGTTWTRLTPDDQSDSALWGDIGVRPRDLPDAADRWRGNRRRAARRCVDLVWDDLVQADAGAGSDTTLQLVLRLRRGAPRSCSCSEGSTTRAISRTRGCGRRLRSVSRRSPRRRSDCVTRPSSTRSAAPRPTRGRSAQVRFRPG